MIGGVFILLVSLACETDAELENALAKVHVNQLRILRLLNPDGSVFAKPKFSADTWAVLEEMAEKMGMDIGSAILRLVEEGLTERRMVKPPATVELDERAAALVSRYSEQWGNKAADVVNGALHFCLEGTLVTVTGATLEEAVDAIAGQRLGLDTKETVALPVYTQDQLAEMGRPARVGRCAKPNPADVALLAAAEPKDKDDDAPPTGEEPPRVEFDVEQMPDYEGDSQDGEEAQ